MYFHTFVVTGHVTDFQRVSRDYFSHNNYWLNYAKKHPNVWCIKYEDLLRDAEGTLAFLNEWLSLEPGQLRVLIEKASKRTAIDGKFFWRQAERNYLNYLSEDQIKLFLRYRGADSERIGYGMDYFLPS